MSNDSDQKFLKAAEWEKLWGTKFIAWRKSTWETSPSAHRAFLRRIHARSSADSHLNLLPHQLDALDRVIFSISHCKPSLGALLLTLATGTGKTALIAALFDFFYQTETDEITFLLLCPNTIVRDRLSRDFLGQKVFHKFGLLTPGIREEEYPIRVSIVESYQRFANIRGYNFLIANRHQLQPGYLGGRDHLSYLAQSRKPLIIFNDEAHNTRAPEYERVLDTLTPQTRQRIDLTATPERADGLRPRSNEIYNLSVTEAMSGSYAKKKYFLPTTQSAGPLVKRLIVFRPGIKLMGIIKASDLSFSDAVSQKTFTVKEISWDDIENQNSLQLVMDPGGMKLQLTLAVQAVKIQREAAAERYKPLLFVIAPSIAGARAAVEMMEKNFALHPLLVVDQADDMTKDEMRAAAANLGTAGSPYDSVVSVYMLREGWDVPEVSVICLLRSFGSTLFAHQTLGRGLRLIRDQEGKPYESPQTLMVIDHSALDLDELWEQYGAIVSDEEPFLPSPTDSDGSDTDEGESTGTTDDDEQEGESAGHTNAGDETAKTKEELARLLFIESLDEQQMREKGHILTILVHALKIIPPLELEEHHIFVSATTTKLTSLQPNRKPIHNLKQLSVDGLGDYQRRVESEREELLTKVLDEAERICSRFEALMFSQSEAYRLLMEEFSRKCFSGRAIGDLSGQVIFHFLASLPSYSELIEREMGRLLKESNPMPEGRSVGRFSYSSEKSPLATELFHSKDAGEIGYAKYLDRDDDVIAWTRAHGIRISYRNSKGGDSMYEPDFLIRRISNGLSVIETKGKIFSHDPDVENKKRAAEAWCKLRGVSYYLIIF